MPGIRSYSEKLYVMTTNEGFDAPLFVHPRLVPRSLTVNLGAPGTVTFDIVSKQQSGSNVPDLINTGHTDDYISDVNFDANQAVLVLTEEQFNNLGGPIKSLTFVTSSSLSPIYSDFPDDSQGTLTTSTVHTVLATMSAAVGLGSLYPSFNVRNGEGEIVGNNGGTDETTYRFDNFITDPQQLVVGENLWSRYDALQLYFHKRAIKGIANFNITMELDEDYITPQVLDILKSKEDKDIDAWDMEQLSLLEALDVLVTNNTNFIYDFIPVLEGGDVKLKLAIYSIRPLTDDLGSVARTDLHLSHRLMGLSENKISPYDEVQIEGNPFVIGGTFSFNHETLKIGWNQDLEDELISTDPGLTDNAEDNIRVRNHSKYDRVFSQFLLDTSETDVLGGTTIYCDTKSAAGKQILNIHNEEAKDLNGDVHEFTGINIAVLDGTRLSILPWIPWYRGLTIDNEGNVTDTRTADQKANPEFHKIKAFRFVQDGLKWVDLLNPSDDTPLPKISVTKNVAGIWLRYPNHPESLAKTKWEEASDPKASSRAPDLDTRYPEAGDYDELYFTAAIESNSKLTSSRYRNNDPNDDIGEAKVLKVKRPYDRWIMKSGSIIEIAGSETQAKILSYDIKVKDDKPKMDRLADDIADYAFEVGSQLTVQYQGTERPSWASLGFAIGTVNSYTFADNQTDPEVQYDYDETEAPPYSVGITRQHITNSIVSSISENYVNNTITITTFRPDPTAVFSSILGPVGAPTTTQVTKLSLPSKTKTETVHEHNRAGGALAPGPVYIQVRPGGNLLLTLEGTDFTGVKGDPDNAPTEVPVATPVEGEIYADGLGIGQIEGQSAKVWVASIVNVNGTDRYDANMTVPSIQYFFAARSIQVPITGGDGATATVYLVWRV